MIYTQSNCITRHKTNRSDTTCTHTEQSLAHLAAHVTDMLQQGLQGQLHACQELQKHQGEDIERGNLVITGTRVAACVEAERLTWWSVWRSAAQRITSLCIEPRSVVLVKVDVREVQHLAHWQSQAAENGQHMNRLLHHRIQ